MSPLRFGLDLLAKGRLSVFLFHKVPHAVDPLAPRDLDLAGFDRLVELVAEDFRIIPLADAVTGLRSGLLPPRAACITFDDGYAGWIDGVVPTLERRNLHATFFITSGQFDGEPLWHERIAHILRETESPMLALPRLGLDHLPIGTLDQKRQAYEILQCALKYHPPELRDELMLEFEGIAGVTSEGAERMPAADLRALHNRGFGIGAHTVSHPILGLCEPERAMREIAGSREAIEGIVSGKVDLFAYPNGIAGRDFGSEHVRMVKRAGYSAAVTTQEGVANLDTSVFQIPRFTPWSLKPARMMFQVMRNLATPPVQLDEAAGEPGNRRKVLMIAFHFPPQVGSSGIQRTLNFVKYLPRNGWAPLVLSAQPRAYENTRDDLVRSIPSETPVFRAFAIDAARHLTIAGKYLLMTALPDRWSSWWLAACVRGTRLVDQYRPRILWSTYPISTAHWIGATLAERTGLKWVADFRDPMITATFPEHPLERKTRQWIEARVMARADCCVFTTRRAAEVYAARYPDAARKCVVIENGYDEESFVDIQPARLDVADGNLLLLHSGVIYPGDRDPTAFFAALRRMIDNGMPDVGRLRVRFRAAHHEAEILRLAEEQGVSSIVEVAAPIPYREAIAEMMGADLLLVLQGANFDSQIPAKIYEYLRARRPLLALVAPQGDTAAQLRQFQATFLADIDDTMQIAEAIDEWLRRRGSRDLEDQLDCNVREVQRYSRNSHAQALAQVFDSLMS